MNFPICSMNQDSFPFKTMGTPLLRKKVSSKKSELVKTKVIWKTMCQLTFLPTQFPT